MIYAAHISLHCIYCPCSNTNKSSCRIPPSTTPSTIARINPLSTVPLFTFSHDRHVQGPFPELVWNFNRQLHFCRQRSAKPNPVPLPDATDLETLDLSFNCFGAKGGEAIGSSLHLNTSLKVSLPRCTTSVVSELGNSFTVGASNGFQ